MIKLEFLNGPLSGEHRLYRHTPVRIGREPGCDLVLDQDTLVSRSHARLLAESDQVILEDLGASNPILVNGHPLQGETMLESGDHLIFGGTEILFRWIEPPRPLQHRRRSLLEWGAMGAAGFILLAQMIFLMFFAPTWRSTVDVAVLRPTPVPEPSESEDVGTASEDTEAPVPPEETEPTGAEATPSLEESASLPTPTPPPLPTPTPIPRTETMEPDEQLELAREFVRNRRFLEADRLLLQLREQEPHFLEAHVEYARLMGRQSRFEESIEAWRTVEQLAEPGSPEAREAAIERPLMERRLRQIQRPLPDPPPPREERPERLPPAALPVIPPERPVPPSPEEAATPTVRGGMRRNPSLLIQDIAVQRFADESVADMREIHFTVQHVFGSRAVAEGDARIVARFYETDGDRIFPARIPSPEVTVRINREMSRGERLRDIPLIYQVPRDLRRDRSTRYYGVVIRAYVGQQLEHELSLPASLLQISN